MSDRTVVGLLRVAVVIGGALAMIGSAMIIAIADVGSWWSAWGGVIAFVSVFFAVFVWLVVPQQPRNALVWTMTASGFFGGVYFAGLASATMLVVDDPNLVLPATSVVPADLPSAAAWILAFTEPASNVATFLLLTFGLLLFPDGRLPSPRWRWVGVLTAVSIVVSTVIVAWSFRPESKVVAYEGEGSLFAAATVATIFAVILSLVGLVSRFRRSSGRTREQFKWILWGASIAITTFTVGIILSGNGFGDLTLQLVIVATAVFLSSYGIAVGRYRLFDIDVVISRTVVVAGLAGFITVVYAAVVGAVGVVFGAGTEAALPLSIAATVVVAIAFQPVRQRMRRWADRLVYGERATPYEVLSRFSERMRDAVVTEDLIPQMARLLTQGTGASRAIVWMESGDELQPVASWPEGSAVPAPVRGSDGGLSIPGVDHLASVEHDGELLGAVTVTMPRGEAMTATEERLVDDVASQAGLVLRNARLTADREQQARERERIDQELRVAALIQQTLLPKQLPALRAWNIDAFYRPAREVGGDFYDFIPLGDGKLGLVIGDVSDKGVPAALVMATCRSMLRAEAPRRKDPGRVLAEVNEALVDEIPEIMFVTCMYAILDPDTGELRYANAGHNLPYVRTEEGVIELRATGMPLGLMGGSAYEVKEATLAEGHTMILSSDGIVEAHDPNGEMYGFPRLMAQVAAHSSGRDLLGDIVADLDRFSGPDREQEDDVTLVAVSRIA